MRETTDTKDRSDGKNSLTMNTPSNVRRVVAGCLLGLAAASLASCSDAPERRADSAKAPTSATARATAADVVGAKADLSGFSCSADDKGSWTASGTLHNNLGTAQTYRLLVSVAKVKTGTVLGSVAKSYDLKAGEERKVTLPDFADGNQAKGLSCVSHVVRGTAT
ncbi:hypothetical protein [Pedococcus bigeumensis]|uniref:hypothetical protein n=1 Tax=Pedococcus bigeumensis TaxID=433644 RepID=UPI002FE744F6